MSLRTAVKSSSGGSCGRAGAAKWSQRNTGIVFGGACQRPDPELPHPIGGAGRVTPVLPELVEPAPEAEFRGQRGMTDRGEGPVAVLAQPRREPRGLEQPRRLPPGAPARVHPGEERRRRAPGLGPGGQRFEEHRSRRAEQVEVRTDVARIAVDPEVVGAQRGDGDQHQVGALGGDLRSRSPHAAAVSAASAAAARRFRPDVHRPSAPARISIRRAPSASRTRRTRVASARRYGPSRSGHSTITTASSSSISSMPSSRSSSGRSIR